MSKKLIILALSAGFLLAGCGESHSEENGINPVDVAPVSSSNLCAEIQNRYENKTINDIMIGEYPQNSNEPFFADIDNDGIDEELKYFNTRTYAYVAEIGKDEVIGLPQAKARSANYSGNAIIKYRDHFFQVHFVKNGVFEIQKLTEKTPQERADKSVYSHRVYNVEILCKYYDD